MRPQDIIEEIEALSTHYVRPVRSPEEHDRWLADYVEDLKKLTVDALRHACRAWRSSPDNNRFPTPGQIAALARSFGLGANLSEDAVRPWGPLDGPSYDRLSLREKIRYHKIAAHEATKHKPPMWWMGRAATLDEMPPERADRWRFYEREALDHWAEVAKLSRILVAQDRSA